MENIIKIPTAAQARDAVKQQANIACEKVWSDILCSVRNAIYSAIEECNCYVYLSESVMHGVSTKAVFQKLHPILSELGYCVKMGQYFGIHISWKEGESRESK